MAIPNGTFGYPTLAADPPNPAVGTILFYVKTDGNAYIIGSSGPPTAIGSVSAVTGLTGDVSASGPGNVAATVNYVGGQSAANIAAAVVLVESATSSNVPSTLVERDLAGNFVAGTITASLNGNASTASSAVTSISFTGPLAGDVTGNQSTTHVALVGGQTASSVAAAAVAVSNAASINTPGTLVLRDGTGSFVAGTIMAAFVGNLTGNVTGNVSGSAASFTGSLAGDVSGTQSATIVQKIQGFAVNSVAPMDAQLFIYNSTSNQWNPTSVSGDVSINHSGVTSIASTIVTGKVLTGYAIGANTPISATDTILGAFEKIQGQLSASMGSSITALTGDVVATGPGSVAATIQPNVVTNSKLAQATADTLKGNNTGSTANVADLTVSQVNTMLGTVTVVGAIDGQSPSANGLVISGNDIYAQSASATVPGMVNLTSQTFAGTKTFSTLVTSVLQSASSNPAASGVIRLANGDAIAWRNSGNSADILLEPHADGILQYGSVDLVNLSATQVLTNKSLAAGSNTITGLTNANLSGSAGITGLNLATNTVTNNNLAQMAANTVKANTSAIPATPVDTALGTVTEATSSVLTLVGWADATIGSPTIQVLQSSTSQSGYLSSTDWNTFNNKQVAGNYITALTGDVVASGPGSAAATVQKIQGFLVDSSAPHDGYFLIYNNGTSRYVPLAMSGDATLADTGALTLATVNSNVGSFGSSTAIPTFTVNAKGLITAASTAAVVAPAGTLTGTTLASNVVNSSLTSVGTIVSGVWNGTALTAAYMLPLANNDIYVGNASNQPAAVAMSGDVAIVASGVTTIQANVVSNSKLAQMAADTLKGNNTGSTANAADLTVSQVNTMLGTITSLTGDITASGPGASAATVVALQGHSVSNSAPSDAQILIWVSGTSKWTPVSVSGDITTTDAGVTTLGKIQGTSISGTTGSGNVVLSASPTLTGTIAAVNANFSGLVSITDAATNALTVNSTSFVVDSVNNAIGIGLQPATNVMIDGINTTLASKLVQMTGYGVGSNTGYRGRFARGTLLSPAAVQAGDILNTLSGRGYGASQFAAASTGVINVVAGETFTNTSNQTYLQFSVTPTASVTSAEHMRVAATGVTLGPQSASTDLHTVNGGWIRTTRTTTASLTVDTTTTDDIIFCNQSAGITITLPTPTNGRTIVIKDISGTAQTNNITVARHATENIEGLAASKVLYTNFGSWTFCADGTNWWMV
jgi:hypothetical protein